MNLSSNCNFLRLLGGISNVNNLNTLIAYSSTLPAFCGSWFNLSVSTRGGSVLMALWAAAGTSALAGSTRRPAAAAEGGLRKLWYVLRLNSLFDCWWWGWEYWCGTLWAADNDSCLNKQTTLAKFSFKLVTLLQPKYKPHT